MRKCVPLLPHQKKYFKKPNYWQHTTMLTRLVDVGLDIKPSLIKKACQLVVNNHISFKLRFRQEEGAWTQYLSGENEDIAFNVFNLQQSSELSVESITDKQRRSFNLENGPLVNFSLISTLETSSLLICAHHLCIDGKSWRIVLREIWDSYSSLQAGGKLQLRNEKVSFARYANYIHENLLTTEIANQIDYWSNRYAELTVDIPKDKELECGGSKLRAYKLGVKNPNVFKLVIVAADTLAIHPQVIFMGALAKSLSHWLSTDELDIDFRSNGRGCFKEVFDLANTVGWCNTTYPLKLSIKPHICVQDLLAMNEALLQAEKNSCGYGLLKYGALSSGSDITDFSHISSAISFNYHGDFNKIFPVESQFRLVSGPSIDYLTPEANRMHLIDVSVYHLGETLYYIWRYDERYHSIKTIKRLASDFSRSVETIIETGTDLTSQ